MEISNYAFAEACKEAKHKSEDGSNAPAKMTIEDLDVYIKIASTKVWKTRSDKSTNLSANRRNVIYENFFSTTKANLDEFQDLAFDNWGLKMKLSAFCRMLTRDFMTNLMKDCYEVLKQKNIKPPTFTTKTSPTELTDDQSSNECEESKIKKRKRKAKTTEVQPKNQKKAKLDVSQFALPKGTTVKKVKKSYHSDCSEAESHSAKEGKKESNGKHTITDAEDIEAEGDILEILEEKTSPKNSAEKEFSDHEKNEDDDEDDDEDEDDRYDSGDELEEDELEEGEIKEYDDEEEEDHEDNEEEEEFKKKYKKKQSKSAKPERTAILTRTLRKKNLRKKK